MTFKTGFFGHVTSAMLIALVITILPAAPVLTTLASLATILTLLVTVAMWLAPQGQPLVVSNISRMEPSESGSFVPPAGEPRLLTISQAAVATGLSRKAIARRIERGTLWAKTDDQGRRVVPLGVLERAGLLRDGDEQGHPGGELVVWRDLYERERQEREQVTERARELERDLVAIANAGPIRAFRLRRELRTKLAD